MRHQKKVEGGIGREDGTCCWVGASYPHLVVVYTLDGYNYAEHLPAAPDGCSYHLLMERVVEAVT
jgi:hypothetical protein